ncbi:MAG: hypothetical protein MJ151_04105, partial [Lachnospiraceae bacterium]|nr:hypothetical protein [Lachnospiraceae bacterium]
EYLNYRVIDFSIVYKESFGMKIPNNCVFKRNCFQIEKQYVENNELDNNYYIYKLDDKNNKKQYKIDISFSDDKYYYVLYDENNNILHINDKITYRDKVYNLSTVKAFEGVFCINKGYKVFKIIKVLDKNNEYSIIDRNAHTNLRDYDILVLNVDF